METEDETHREEEVLEGIYQQLLHLVLILQLQVPEGTIVKLLGDTTEEEGGEIEGDLPLVRGIAEGITSLRSQGLSMFQASDSLLLRIMMMRVMMMKRVSLSQAYILFG